MSSKNWYETDSYLHRLYESSSGNLNPFPKKWEELQGWCRLIDKRIPSNSLYRLIKCLESSDIMGKNQMRDFLAYVDILSKRDFNQIWKSITFTEEGSEEKEPTVKEIVDIIAQNCFEEFDILTLKESNQLMIRNSIHYTLDIDPLEEYIIREAEPYSKGNYTNYVKEVEKKLSTFTKISQYDFYTDPWVVSFENGVYDVTTGNFHESDSPICKDLKLFYSLPHKYKTGIYRCPKFKKALSEWLGIPFSRTLYSDIFEAIGYCLTMNNSLKTAFLSYGPPDTGKTQLLNIIMELVGPKNRATIGLQRLSHNDFASTFIQHKILNGTGETPKRKLYDTDKIKNATGGDVEISAEVKGGKIFSMPSYCKFWFNANKIPAIDDPNDSAFLSRFILFHFPNVFPQKECTRDFYKEIMNEPSELQGIIHEALRGLKRLYKRNGFRTKLRENTRHIWLYESDHVYKFLYDFCLYDKGEMIPSEELWEYFNDVSEISLTKQKLTIELQKYKINKKQVRTPTNDKPDKRTEMYIGITLKERREKKEKVIEKYDRLFVPTEKIKKKEEVKFKQERIDLSDPNQFRI